MTQLYPLKLLGKKKKKKKKTLLNQVAGQDSRHRHSGTKEVGNAKRILTLKVIRAYMLYK